MNKGIKNYINNCLSGIFYSKKNNCEYVFRSIYEFAYFYQLEKNNDVLKYIVEPFKIPYRNPYDKKTHYYYPDVIVYYKSGLKIIYEIKPFEKIKNIVVQKKANATKKYIKKNNLADKYLFITEKDIFKSNNDYLTIKKILKSQIRN